MPQSWYLFQSGPADAPRNMAWDEVLLEAIPQLARPLVRFYGWTELAGTFGYFQKHAEVEQMTALRPLIRRPTGGGFVSHAADWTYSLLAPPAHPWYALKATESYERIHKWIQAAFEALNVQTILSPIWQNPLPGQCFAGPERFDLVWQGRKIAGAAQRRMRHGLLIQGSVQPLLPGICRTDWEKAFCDVATVRENLEWTSFEPDLPLTQRAIRLASEKYGQLSYNGKR